MTDTGAKKKHREGKKESLTSRGFFLVFLINGCHLLRNFFPVQGELQIFTLSDPSGRISFENVLLNKLFNIHCGMNEFSGKRRRKKCIFI
jgi:hypothetical protein